MQKMLEDMTDVEYDFTKRLYRMYIFEIHSTPKPQQQTEQGRTHSGKRIFYDPSKLNKKAIQWQISPHAPSEPLRGAIELHLTFYLPIPKSTRKGDAERMRNNVYKHIRRPDLDNLAYLVTNAMKGIVYYDDSQICKMSFEKMYSDSPRTIIKVMEV